MTFTTPRSSRSGRFAELALWSTAGLVVLTAHIAAAAVLLKQEPSPPADQGPPAAIMIEMAAEPVAQNTEEDQVSTEEVDSEEIASRQVEPVEEPLPEPLPEPVEPPPPEEVAELEPVKPEPEPVEPEPIEQPEPEITETIPEPAPEPVEEVDPLEQQMIAALDNVEVPLPIMRPPPPPEPKKEPPKRAKPQPQAAKASQKAKLQTRQADRTAATQTSQGTSRPSESLASWHNKVRGKLNRYATARNCPGTGTVTARLRIDGSGNISAVSVSRSSGDARVDDYIVSAIHRASPVAAPPPGEGGALQVPFLCN
ncbi:MAG: energy transducer TonB [Rhizobiales bacterium]|nr:energy transducer TonB [Hyphomicrobiales bacterium]